MKCWLSQLSYKTAMLVNCPFNCHSVVLKEDLEAALITSLLSLPIHTEINPHDYLKQSRTSLYPLSQVCPWMLISSSKREFDGHVAIYRSAACDANVDGKLNRHCKDWLPSYQALSFVLQLPCDILLAWVISPRIHEMCNEILLSLQCNVIYFQK